MRYLALIYGNRELWESMGPDDWSAAVAAHDAFNARYRSSGELIASMGLADASETRLVRFRAGVPVVTDGPYLETREYIASAWIFDVTSEARAIELAAEIPYASVGAVEVWPVSHGDGTGQSLDS